MAKSDIITRKELVQHICDEYGYEYELVDEITLRFLSEIKLELLAGNNVSFANERFGKFEIVKGKARNYRLPKSDLIRVAPERKRVKFRPSSTLKIVSA